MKQGFKAKSMMTVALVASLFAGVAIASSGATKKPREERLVFPNVMDDAAADTYSPLIWCFLGGTVLVGCARAVALRKKKVRQYVSLSVDQ